MPLHLRLRGTVWHARGTVRVGDKVAKIAEFSTGRAARAEAEKVAGDREKEVAGDLLDGAAGRAKRLTLIVCILAYMRRPGGVPAYDNFRLQDLGERIGSRLLSEAPEAWAEWLRTRGASMAPGTAARWRAILQAAINYGASQHQVMAPKLPTVRQRPSDGVRYLTRAEQDRLLAAYSQWAAPVALVLCFGGLRSQEALQLDWRHVDWQRRTLFVAQSKSGRVRMVPMHQRVVAELSAIWEARKYPETGPVFLSRRGRAYTDTKARECGGNPLAKAHATACRVAGITSFRVHDWRHHWASWMIMSGCDLFTLMRIGGWSTPKMVQRYAAVSHEHLEAAIARLG